MHITSVVGHFAVIQDSSRKKYTEKYQMDDVERNEYEEKCTHLGYHGRIP